MTTLVYLSAVPWASFSQRPHKFAEWFHAKHGGRVLWVDPYPTRLPTLQDFRRMRAGVQEPAQEVPDWMQVHTVKTLPIEPLPFSASLHSGSWRKLRDAIEAFATASGEDCELVVGKPSKLALVIMDLKVFRRVTYDAMDDFPAFYAGLSRVSFARTEARVARRADRILVSSEALARKFSGVKDLVHARNACDPAKLLLLEQVASLREPDLIGYVGTIATWFDWELLVRLARARPDLRFRLTGPKFVPTPGDLPANVSIQPPCDHQAAMREMARFAVGLIPFRLTPLTAAVDPVKYYEYRAMGIPVLSSAFGEMVPHARTDAGVFLADRDPVAALHRALAHREATEVAQQFLSSNAWHARFDILDSLDSTSPASAPVQVPTSESATALKAASERARVIAVVVTYRPDPLALRRMLLALVPQVARICVVDNSDGGGGTVIDACRDIDLHCIGLGRNAGIALAQNIGIAWALEEHASHVLLMDQDSLPAPDMVGQLLTALTSQSDAAGVGPSYVDSRTGRADGFVRIKRLRRRRIRCEPHVGLVEVDHLIASGCLIPTRVLQHVGLMRDDLFIDYVDIEWGLRARRLGFRSFGVCAAQMEHTLGDDYIHVGQRFIPAHSPLRHYYQIRNAVLVLRESIAFPAWRVLDVQRVMLMLILFSVARPPRLAHLRMMCLGLWHGLLRRAGSYEEARSGFRSKNVAPGAPSDKLV